MASGSYLRIHPPRHVDAFTVSSDQLYALRSAGWQTTLAGALLGLFGGTALSTWLSSGVPKAPDQAAVFGAVAILGVVMVVWLLLSLRSFNQRYKNLTSLSEDEVDTSSASTSGAETKNIDATDEETDAGARWTRDRHLVQGGPTTRSLFEKIEADAGKRSDVDERYTKTYVAWRVRGRVFMTAAITQDRIKLYFRLSASDVPATVPMASGTEPEVGHARDVRDIGKAGIGDVEFLVGSERDLRNATRLANAAYRAVSRATAH